MKKALLISAVCAVTLSACTKKDHRNEGTIWLINQSESPCRIFIAGKAEGIVKGKTTRFIKKDAGSYQIAATQQTGPYIYYPEASQLIQVPAGGKAVFVFP